MLFKLSIQRVVIEDKCNNYHFHSLLFFFLLNLVVKSTNCQTSEYAEQGKFLAKIESGHEYISPSSNDRIINTISLNAFFKTRYFKDANLNIDLGFTTTYAWGKSRDYDSHHLVYHNIDAWGAGPVIQFEQLIFEMNRYSIFGEASPGIIFYNKDFPNGGDFYNFMLRAGIVCAYKFNKSLILNLSFKWMHVSNGQGSGPHNPFYEGYGTGLSLTKYLYRKN